MPAILEFLPYRYGDLTAERDHRTLPYWAARGYACARVDLRGTGNSTGVIEDEYTRREQLDGAEVIAWLASQPWCSGAVGMTGISWGGFNALQVAALRPPALRAVVTVCSTDDRYADDVHYRGGCLLALDMLQWATSMLTWNALPPDPLVAGAAWRERWLARIEQTPAFVERWMRHQRRDEYWRQGSVCEDYAAIEVPVYAIGGWADGYSDAVLRLLANLRCPRKGLIGPWSHSLPNESVPGPRIGYLEEALRWWDHWLKGADTGIMDEPPLRVWMQDWTAPAPWHGDWPGRWVVEEEWPPPPHRTLRRRWWLDAGPLRLEEKPAPPASVRHRSLEAAGLEEGAICADGGFGDWPGDERAEDGRALSFTSAPLSADLEILGHPVARIELACDRPVSPLVVRLCEVAEDGSSLRVTWGLLQLTRRQGMDRSEPMEPGSRTGVAVPLKAIAHRFRAGHRIRLAVSSTSWPWVWPAPEPVELTVFCGDASVLELPVRRESALDVGLRDLGPPEDVPGLAVERLESRPTSRTVRKDLVTGEASVVFDWDVGGRVRLPDGLEVAGSNRTTYAIREGCPLSARVETVQSQSLRRGDDYDVEVRTRAEMTCGADRFLVTAQLDALEGSQRVAARQWRLEFPRDGL